MVDFFCNNVFGNEVFHCWVEVTIVLFKVRDVLEFVKYRYESTVVKIVTTVIPKIGVIQKLVKVFFNVVFRVSLEPMLFKGDMLMYFSNYPTQTLN